MRRVSAPRRPRLSGPQPRAPTRGAGECHASSVRRGNVAPRRLIESPRCETRSPDRVHGAPLGVVPEWGDDLPFVGALAAGSRTRGPLLSEPAEGIYRSCVQRGPAALSIQTSDEHPLCLARGRVPATPTEPGTIDPARQPSAARRERARGPRSSTSSLPARVVQADPPGLRDCGRSARGCSLSRRALCTGPIDEPKPVALEDPIDNATWCKEDEGARPPGPLRGPSSSGVQQPVRDLRVKELRLLDAEQLISDFHGAGEPSIKNGLRLCAIHHRAFDQNLVAIAELSVYVKVDAHVRCDVGADAGLTGHHLPDASAAHPRPRVRPSPPALSGARIQFPCNPETTTNSIVV